MDKISKFSNKRRNLGLLLSLISTIILLSSFSRDIEKNDYLRYTIDYEYIAVPVQSQNQQPCAYEIWKVPIGDDNKMQEEFILRVNNCKYSTTSN